MAVRGYVLIETEVGKAKAVGGAIGGFSYPGASVTAVDTVTVGKWPYSHLHKASPALQSKMLQIFFRLAAERLKKADEQYLLLYQKHLKENNLV